MLKYKNIKIVLFGLTYKIKIYKIKTYITNDEGKLFEKIGHKAMSLKQHLQWSSGCNSF